MQVCDVLHLTGRKQIAALNGYFPHMRFRAGADVERDLHLLVFGILPLRVGHGRKIEIAFLKQAADVVQRALDFVGRENLA